MLGFPAADVAAMLDTSVDSVKSAVKRARVAVRARPAGEPAPAAGSARERAVVERFARAWADADLDALVTPWPVTGSARRPASTRGTWLASGCRRSCPGGSLAAVRCGAVDVFYPEDGGARAALVISDGPAFGAPLQERVAWLDDVAPYEPGAFFKRELPAMRAVLDQAGPLDLVVVDGYVDLDPAGRPGLGARLHEQIGVPVIGVAKTAFRSAVHAVAVRRGSATRPLYVTAAGMPVDEAAGLVVAMAGAHRMPDALRRVDQLSRGR